MVAVNLEADGLPLPFAILQSINCVAVLRAAWNACVVNDAMTNTRDLVKLKPVLVRKETEIGVIAEVNLGSLDNAAPVLSSEVFQDYRVAVKYPLNFGHVPGDVSLEDHVEINDRGE